MKRIPLSKPPRQMDFWESNVVPLHYTLPIGISDAELQRIRVALIEQRRERDKQHENWKHWMYSMRLMIGQFGYRAYKKNNRIIVERIQYFTSLAYHRRPPRPDSVGMRTALGKSLRQITRDWIEERLSRR